MCSPWTPRSRHSRRRWRRTPWTCVSPSCQHHLSGAEPKRLELKSKLIIALNLFHHLPKVFLLHLPVWMFSDEGVELFPDVLQYITVARRHSTSSLSCWPKKRKSNNTLHNLDWGFGVFNHGNFISISLHLFSESTGLSKHGHILISQHRSRVLVTHLVHSSKWFINVSNKRSKRRIKTGL